jgi:hypothetical protein
MQGKIDGLCLAADTLEREGRKHNAGTVRKLATTESLRGYAREFKREEILPMEGYGATWLENLWNNREEIFAFAMVIAAGLCAAFMAWHFLFYIN